MHLSAEIGSDTVRHAGQATGVPRLPVPCARDGARRPRPDRIGLV